MNEFVTRPPEAAHAPLFARCFDLSEEEARAIIAAIAPDATALIFETGDGIAAECFLIPLMLGGHYGMYLYGVCVAPEKRGRGYMRRMLKSAREYAARVGCDFLVLIPGDSDLRETYRRMGFTQEIGLHADAKGEAFYLLPPPPTEQRPFDGDYAALYLHTDRRLPFSAFCAALETVEGDIWLTGNGTWRICEKNDISRCFACDGETLKKSVCEGGDTGLLLPIRPLTSLPPAADPLPR